MEDYELCKQLTELTGWQEPFDTDYLLTKLEDIGETIILRYNNPENMTALALSDWNKQYTAATASMTQGSYPIADTPKTALLKLAIELAKAGVIGKEGE